MGVKAYGIATEIWQFGKDASRALVNEDKATCQEVADLFARWANEAFAAISYADPHRQERLDTRGYAFACFANQAQEVADKK